MFGKSSLKTKQTTQSDFAHQDLIRLMTHLTFLKAFFKFSLIVAGQKFTVVSGLVLPSIPTIFLFLPIPIPSKERGNFFSSFHI